MSTEEQNATFILVLAVVPREIVENNSLHSGKSNGTDDASDVSAAHNQHAQSSAEETKLGCVDFGPQLSPTWSSTTLERPARQWLLRAKRSGCERLNDDRLKLLSASPAQPRLLAEEQYAIQSGWSSPLKTEPCQESGARLAFPMRGHQGFEEVTRAVAALLAPFQHLHFEAISGSFQSAHDC